jgi:hypothetical protein
MPIERVLIQPRGPVPILLDAVRIPSNVLTGPQVVLEHFAWNRFSITILHRQMTRRLATHVVASWRTPNPIRHIVLIGHTDNTGQSPYNLQLGKRRATAVRRKLSIAINRLSPGLATRTGMLAQSAGATRPVASNATTEGRARNRRVEVWLSGYPDRNELDPRNPKHVRWLQDCLGVLMGAPLAANGVAGVETRNAIRRFQYRQRLAVNGMISPPTVAALVRLCGLPQSIPRGPAVKMRTETGRPDRWVGDGGDNIREDVRNTMDRLHLLWSISNPNYDTEYPGVSALPLASTVPAGMIPLTNAAIGRNFDPTLHPAVASHFLNVSLSDPVGRGQRNKKNDVLTLEVSLRALGLLSDRDFAVEHAAVSSLTTPIVPGASIPRTIEAIRSLKDAIAGGRIGWAALRSDEAEAGGDRFGGRTLDFTISSLCHIPADPGPPAIDARTAVVPFGVSIFVPRGVNPGVNRVHVFFSPGGVTGDSGFNAILMHGLRAAMDSSEWILIGVPGIDGGWCTIDRGSISSCLARIGRAPDIHALRLSGHSRGASGMRESIRRGFLRGSIDRVFVLDASDAFRSVSVSSALRNGQASAGGVVQYAVNLFDLPGAVNIRLDPHCVRAIGYTRLVQDSMVTRPTLALPPAITRQLLPLPPRGGFTAAATSSAGQPNLRADCRPRTQTCFCRDQRSAIAAIIRGESNPGGLLTFIHANDLTRFGRQFTPGIYSHHLFVAEIVHELVA